MLAIKFTVILNVLTVVFSDNSAKSDRLRIGNSDNDRVIFPGDLRPDRDDHHHHHHHTHEYHQHSYGGNVEERKRGPSEGGANQEIIPENGFNSDSADQEYNLPLDFAKHISQFNVSELLLHYVEGEEHDMPASILLNRFGGPEEGTERNAKKEMPESAICMPALEIVRLAPKNPEYFYIPECTRVERCGGCCSNKLLSCQPTEIEYKNYEVVKTKLFSENGFKKLKYIGRDLVVLEKHTKCKCACKIKAEDCSKYQKYNENQCACNCTNYDEMEKCSKQSTKKLWNPTKCFCQCREVLPCSTGYDFDPNECRCKAASVRQRYVNIDPNKGEYDDLAVEELPDY